MSEGLARNTLHSSIAGLIYSLGRFFTTVVLARTVGVHDTGVVNYVLWLIAFAGALTDMGAYTTLSRYLPEFSRDSSHATVEGFVRHLFWPFLALAAVPAFLLVSVLLASNSGDTLTAGLGLGVDKNLVLLILILYLAQVLSNFALGYLQGMQQFRRMVWFAAVAMSLQITIVGAAGLVWGAKGALIGYIVGCAVPASLCWRFLSSWRPLPGTLRRRVHRFAAYSWASTIASALVWGRLETPFLNHFWGSEAIGLYSVGFTLASLAVQGPLLLTGALLPYFSEVASAEDRNKLQVGLETGTRFLVFVTLPLAFVTAAVVAPLLRLFFGPEFAAASQACAILVIGTGLWACSTVATNLLIGLERSDFIFFAHLSGAVVSVGLSLILIPSLGITGAATARASAQIYVSAVTFWFISSRMGFTLPIRKSASLLIASAGSGLVAYIVGNSLSGPLSVPLAVVTAASVYLGMARLLHGITSRDAATLRIAADNLPGWLRTVFQVALVVIAPPAGKR